MKRLTTQRLCVAPQVTRPTSALATLAALPHQTPDRARLWLREIATELEGRTDKLAQMVAATTLREGVKLGAFGQRELTALRQIAQA